MPKTQNDEETRISANNFIGVKLTTELEMHLNNSIRWREIQAFFSNEEELTKAHFQGKDFLGRMIRKERLSIKEVRQEELFIRTKLQEYCPEMNINNLHTKIFPQILIS